MQAYILVLNVTLAYHDSPLAAREDVGMGILMTTKTALVFGLSLHALHL